MAIPLFEACDIAGRDITADALLTQRGLAEYIVAHQAHYHFTAKDNQKTLARDIRRHFQDRGDPDYTEPLACEHGRIGQRRIWCTSALNDYLDFPHVGQAWLIERDSTDKKTGKHSRETVVGLTSRTAEQMTPKQLLTVIIGVSKASITSSTGIMMKIAVGFAPVMARLTSRGYAASPSAFLKVIKNPASIFPK